MLLNSVPLAQIKCWYCTFQQSPASVLLLGYYTLGHIFRQHLEVPAMGQHHGTHSASRPASLYRWLGARLKCRGSLFTQLCGATAEQAQTMGPCSPLVSEGKNGDLLTWQPEASMPPLHVAERVRVRERRRGRKEKGKVEIRKKENGEVETERNRVWHDWGSRKRDKEVERNDKMARPLKIQTHITHINHKRWV